ncbi:MAG: TRAP transporter small permease subunit [Alphaproteobacteria bacterium]|nr:TRAP transporter small permease subunit [Alphaproteobacteria bacterium]MCY4229735.1 TRAP transporter small permease subunit [Alphaproteobacteria bacterium]MCY4320383.1 TRAP transporter small permease subunit [Alphaproteobacteria bacterium]
MAALIGGIERLSQSLGVIGAWVMAPLILSMVYEVLARHLFNAPTFWAYEVGYMLAGTCYLSGMAYCMKERGHIRVDFIYDNIGPKGRAVVDVCGFLLLMFPGAIWVTIGLYEYAYEAFESGEVSGESAWNPVIWPFRTVWVIAFAVLCLQAFAELLRSARVLFGLAGEEDFKRHGAAP